VKEKGKSGEKGKKIQRISCFSLFPFFHFAFVTQESKPNTMDISTEKWANSSFLAGQKDLTNTKLLVF
jgi:hypothetical protein